MSLQGETGTKVNIVTSSASLKTSELKEQFVSRMFSPEVPGGEDSVCGSAHCLLVPYWYTQKNLERGTVNVAKQVSPRGGVLHVVWDGDTIKLRGESAILFTGNLCLPGV